jgi:hypothetical protein
MSAQRPAEASNGSGAGGGAGRANPPPILFNNCGDGAAQHNHESQNTMTTPDTTYSKKSTCATPVFPGAPKGVYLSRPGHVNTPHDGPAGGEVKRSDILNCAGDLAKPNYTDLSRTYPR